MIKYPDIDNFLTRDRTEAKSHVRLFTKLAISEERTSWLVLLMLFWFRRLVFHFYFNYLQQYYYNIHQIFFFYVKCHVEAVVHVLFFFHIIYSNSKKLKRTKNEGWFYQRYYSVTAIIIVIFLWVVCLE